MGAARHPIDRFLEARTHMNRRIGTLAAAAAVGLVGLATDAHAQATLAQVKERGFLNCQVGLPTPGFYGAGRRRHLVGHRRRRVPRGLRGHLRRPRQGPVPVGHLGRALHLARQRRIDMLSRTTTWTAVRDTQLGLDFTTGQLLRRPGLPRAQRQRHHLALELDGATVCVLTGTTTELNLADYFRANNMEFTPVTNENVNVLVETYLGGGCDAYTNDKSGLAARRRPSRPVGPRDPARDGLEGAPRPGRAPRRQRTGATSFAGSLRHDRSRGARRDLRERRGNAATSDNPGIARLLGVEGNIGEGLGLAPDFMVNVLKHVGNYGEVYERNVGEEHADRHPARRHAERPVDRRRHPLRDALPLSLDRYRPRAPRGRFSSGKTFPSRRSARWPLPNRPRCGGRAGLSFLNDETSARLLPGPHARLRRRPVLVSRHNTIENMSTRGHVRGLRLPRRLGRLRHQLHAHPLSEGDSYWRVFQVGIANTLLVAVIGIFWRHRDRPLRRAGAPVLQLADPHDRTLVCRGAAQHAPAAADHRLVFRRLQPAAPPPRQSRLGRHVLPQQPRLLHAGAGPGRRLPDADGLRLALAGAIGLRYWARKRQEATGKHFPAISVGLAMVVSCRSSPIPALGRPLAWEMPVLQGFNFTGGAQRAARFCALVMALSIYTSCFIAEIVRSGIQSVSGGQTRRRGR
jgi:general L-amino acid transport system substrate-binding protein